MSKAAAAPALKAHQLEALAAILPPTAEVAQMLAGWRGADARYWGAQLTPCWLTSNIEPYGKCIGSWNSATRTLNVIPRLFSAGGPESALMKAAMGVVIHEACHQAQGQLYRHLDQARGPRGRWTDSSHRCPSWSRAVEDVIQAEGLATFCPVWHRSTGNVWRPWVPASADWLTWKRVEPGDTFDGRRLLEMDEARAFMGAGVTLPELLAAAGLETENAKGEPIQWDL